MTLKNDPYSASALDAMAGVRRAAPRPRKRRTWARVATVQLGGVTPTQADTRAVNDRDKALVIPLVLVLVAIVLGLLLRSLIAPLYLLAAVTLNYFAALGLSSFIFSVQGDEGLGYTIPLYTFIFLVALGADYTIFLMSRVREEAAQHGIKRGMQIALSRTGGVITSAGLILAGTFRADDATTARTLPAWLHRRPRHPARHLRGTRLPRPGCRRAAGQVELVARWIGARKFKEHVHRE